jgi:hypothetical protein
MEERMGCAPKRRLGRDRSRLAPLRAPAREEGVDGRHEAGHDDKAAACRVI